MVGRGGLEPPTSRLSGVRSNHLSYRPKSTGGNPLSDLKRHEDGLDRLLDRQAGPAKYGPRGPEETSGTARAFLRKEVIQPQVPLRLPCYDFTPVADPTVAACPPKVGAASSGRTNSHGVTGGVYKARERIHRGMLIHDY